jgi:transcriptional regulator with XRE-family HTH domain
MTRNTVGEGNRLGSLVLEIGRALRRIRKERGFTLREVAATSGGAFKATSVAGYERGERSITLERFVMLCRLYGAVPEQVLAGVERAVAGDAEPSIDLSGIDVLGEQEGELLTELVRQVNEMRRERSTGAIMVRSDDLAVLATASGTDPDELLEALRTGAGKSRKT